jgi:uncharacterized membrane protein YoaK (UPF0700 family)
VQRFLDRGGYVSCYDAKRAKGAGVRQTTITQRFAVVLTLANGFLDAHTYLARGGVFANVQTGNVIFFAINVFQKHWASSFSRLWPIFAFTAGVAVAAHIKSGRIDKAIAHPLRWTMGVQATVLTAFGFLPATVSASLVTVPISFLAGMQIGLFRRIGDLTYMPVATTGNLMRLVEAGYDGFVENDNDSRRAFVVYATLIGSFATGAMIGALATREWGVHAIWIPAGCLAVALALLAIDDREGKVL